MQFGKRRHTDRKVGVLADELDELDGVAKVAEAGTAVGGWVAGERKYVVDAVRLVLGEELTNLLARVADTGQVGHGGKWTVVVDTDHEVASAIARRATRAIGDRDERRTELGEHVEVLLERAQG